MGLICGWHGQTGESAEEILERMSSHSPLPARNLRKQTTSFSAVASAGAEHRHSTACGEGICATLEGHPRWLDRELAAISTSRSNAYALLEGFRRHGTGVLKLLRGDFALSVSREDRKQALLAVDRIGIRPLAWTLAGDTLVFGSMLSNILAHPAAEGTIHPQGIFNYLYFHMVPSPGTLYRGLNKLQPGEYVEFTDGKIRRGRYWTLEFTENRRDRKTLSEELHIHLKEGVRSCLLDDTPAGTFLSGGLDSSTVTGVMQSLEKKPVDAFAIGFQADGFDEMEYARATAEHFGVRLHEYYVTPQDVLDAIPLAARAYDEPFGNASAIPAYYCAKAARDQGKVLLLAGDGGDEIFAGNARYAKQKLFDIYEHVPGILKTVLIEPLASKLPPLRKLRSYIEQASVPMPQRMETYNFLHRYALREIFSPEFLQHIDADVPLKLLRQRWEACGDASLVKRMLFLDHKFTLADNDLRKVNRMCELADIDVRYPLLQEEMVEFAARIPTDMLLKGQQLRTFYRQAMKGFLARKTLEKHKHGFGLPFGLWMNEHPPLKEFAHANLEGIRRRGILNEEFISKIIKAQETGHATYYGVFIWILIMLEQWLETHGETADFTV